jgi:hypothetical protein
MSRLEILNITTGERRFDEAAEGSPVPLKHGERVIAVDGVPWPPPTDDLPHTLPRDELDTAERTVRALEQIVEHESRRNELLEASIGMQTEVLNLARQEREQRDEVFRAMTHPSAFPTEAGSVSARADVGQRLPAGDLRPGQGVGTDPASDIPEPEAPEPELYAVLRDPNTAPPAWINKVTRFYDGQAPALEEASRLAGKHGGRFLVLKVESYAEASPRIWGGAPGAAPPRDLLDLPF